MVKCYNFVLSRTTERISTKPGTTHPIAMTFIFIKLKGHFHFQREKS